jgi:hypothetical protein
MYLFPGITAEIKFPNNFMENFGASAVDVNFIRRVPVFGM